MCGLSLLLQKNSIDRKLFPSFKRMNNSVRHRGPDDEGYVMFDRNLKFEIFGGEDAMPNNNYPSYFPNKNFDLAVSKDMMLILGFRRLSIIDLSALGHQPMSFLENRYWIVFNGEIYNYIELKNELEKLGYNFRSNSDTEVIMASYDCWGVDCLNKFNGMWAFALVDRKNNELFVARDRFGIKPLFYYMKDDSLLLASEIKQFINFKGLDIKPNIPKIKKEFFEDSKEFTDDTHFTNVFRFPKASYIKLNLLNWSKESFCIQKYYNLPKYNSFEKIKYSEEKAIQLARQYYDLLTDAIRIRLRTDVLIGTCFSGGLDSSSIVYIVNKLLKEENAASQQKTFSLVFNSVDTRHCDESKFIDLLTTELDLNSKKIEPNLGDVISHYKSVVYAMDNIQNSTLMSYLFTYRLVKMNNVTVTLDGQGADELQGGYLYYLINYFSNLPLKLLWPEYKIFVKNPGSKKFILFGIIFNMLRKCGLKPLTQLLIKNKQKNPWCDVNEMLLHDFDTHLQTLFHYGDRGSMMNSVESRYPMMDYRLVEFWMKLPESFKLKNGYTKYIARLAFDKKLPDTIVWRRDKKGWEMPQYVWLKNGLFEAIKKETYGNKFIAKMGLNFKVENCNLNKSSPKYWKLPIKTFNLAIWHKLFFE